MTPEEVRAILRIPELKTAFVEVNEVDDNKKLQLSDPAAPIVCLQLQNIRLNPTIDDLIQGLSFPSLLRFHLDSEYVRLSSINILLDACPNLTDLSIDCISETLKPSACIPSKPHPTLQSLTIHSCAYGDADNYALIIAQFPNLLSLNLHLYDEHDVAVWPRAILYVVLAGGLLRLETLTFDEMPIGDLEINDRRVRLLLAALPNIRRFGCAEDAKWTQKLRVGMAPRKSYLVIE